MHKAPIPAQETPERNAGTWTWWCLCSKAGALKMPSEYRRNISLLARTCTAKLIRGKQPSNSEPTQWTQDTRHFISACTNVPRVLQNYSICTAWLQMHCGFFFLYLLPLFEMLDLLENNRKCNICVVVLKQVAVWRVRTIKSNLKFPGKFVQ